MKFKTLKTNSLFIPIVFANSFSTSSYLLNNDDTDNSDQSNSDHESESGNSPESESGNSSESGYETDSDRSY